MKTIIKLFLSSFFVFTLLFMLNMICSIMLEIYGEFKSDMNIAKGFNSRVAGFIDETGKIIIEPSHELLGYKNYFKDGRLYSISGKVYIDKEGKRHKNIERYALTKEIREKLAEKGLQLKEDYNNTKPRDFYVVEKRIPYSQKFKTMCAGIVDKDLNLITDLSLNIRGSFKNGLARAEEDSICATKVAGHNEELEDAKYGFINPQGEFVIKPQYVYAESFSKEGIARVCTEENGKRNCYDINSDGNRIDKEYKKDHEKEETYNFGELIPKNTGEKWGYTDKNGKMVIEAQFADAEKFSEGIAKVYFKATGHTYSINNNHLQFFKRVNSKNKEIVESIFYKDSIKRYRKISIDNHTVHSDFSDVSKEDIEVLRTANEHSDIEWEADE